MDDHPNTEEESERSAIVTVKKRLARGAGP